MANTVRHYRLPPEAIARRLQDLGITPWQFAAQWEVKRETVNRWLLDVDHPKALDPPFWVTIALELLRLPGAAERVREIHEAYKVSNDDEHAPQAL